MSHLNEVVSLGFSSQRHVNGVSYTVYSYYIVTVLK